jgi:hypothetical protein
VNPIRRRVCFYSVLVFFSMTLLACERAASPTQPSIVADSPDNSMVSSVPDMTVNSPDFGHGITPLGMTMTSPSYCQFRYPNPYQCCVNNPGVYGNCTGGAWQKAFDKWTQALPPGVNATNWAQKYMPGWGNPNTWPGYAAALGYLVETTPTVDAMGVNATHAAFVTTVKSSSVTTIDQACGIGSPNGYYYVYDKPWSRFSSYIRAPIPVANLLLYSGGLETSNGGTLTVKRGATVQFGFKLLRPNVAAGPSTYAWTIGGASASTAGMFSKSFSTVGSYLVGARVTNKLGLSVYVTATIKVI